MLKSKRFRSTWASSYLCVLCIIIIIIIIIVIIIIIICVYYSL